MPPGLIDRTLGRGPQLYGSALSPSSKVNSSSHLTDCMQDSGFSHGIARGMTWLLRIGSRQLIRTPIPPNEDIRHECNFGFG